MNIKFLSLLAIVSLGISGFSFAGPKTYQVNRSGARRDG